MVSWSSHVASEPAEWRDAAFLGGMSVPLTAAELDEVGDKLHAVLKPFIERLRDPATRPPDSRIVRVFLAATPSMNGAHESNGEPE